MGEFAVMGVGLTAVLIGLAIGFAINAVILWIVTRFMLAVPDVTFGRCFVLVLWMTGVTLLMLIPLFLLIFLPLIGPIIWLILWLKALKATIEGVLEIQEGGWTILVIYVLVQVGVNWMLRGVG